MISNADIRYFTAPINTSFAASKVNDDDLLLVTQVAHSRHTDKLGTIMKVRKDFTSYLGSRWRITEAGDYVNGHIVNSTETYGPFIGKRAEGDEAWIVGASRISNAPGIRIISNVRRSDGRTFNTIVGRAEYDVLTQWVPAAQWAIELFPSPGDSSATAAAKLELAKARWEMNSAIAHIETEGRTRGWTEDLKELREGLDFLPQPVYDLLVTGQALVRTDRTARSPRVDDLPEHVRTAVARLGSSSLRGESTVNVPVYPISVAFTAQTRVNANNSLFAHTHELVSNSFLSQFRSNDYDVSLGAYETTPYVGALNTYL